jgi:hypothetical protein
MQTDLGLYSDEFKIAPYISLEWKNNTNIDTNFISISKELNYQENNFFCKFKKGV